MMRITFTQINDTVLRNIGRNYAKMANLQEQISSGKRLNRPSDDPIDMKNNINYKAELAMNSQFKRNIEDGQAWIGMTETAMTDMNEIMQRLRELALQGSNDTLIGRERGYIAQEVDQLNKQLVTLANSRYKGNFIFGGTNGDKPIYEYTNGTRYTFNAGVFNGTGVANAMTVYEEGNIYQYKRLDAGSVSLLVHDNATGIDTAAVEGTDYNVDYALGTISAIGGGVLSALNPTQEVRVTFNHYNKVNRETNGIITREIEEGVKPQINMSADEVFEDSTTGTDLVGTITNLLDGLKRDNSSKINTSISEMDNIFAKMRAAQSRNGARLNRFDLTLERNSNRNIEVSRLQSDLEDVDFAQAVTDFSLSENVYSASLKAGAKVILPTLGDYI